jgi:hypothetical protein
MPYCRTTYAASASHNALLSSATLDAMCAVPCGNGGRVAALLPYRLDYGQQAITPTESPTAADFTSLVAEVHLGAFTKLLEVGSQAARLEGRASDAQQGVAPCDGIKRLFSCKATEPRGPGGEVPDAFSKAGQTRWGGCLAAAGVMDGGGWRGSGYRLMYGSRPEGRHQLQR